MTPSTSDYVRFHALHRPGAIALIENGREVDYATFHRDLRKFTRALRGLGLPPRSLVAVAWEGAYLHWLLLLACENLGLATASFQGDDGGGMSALMVRARLVLGKRKLPGAGGAKQHLLTQDWLDGVFASPDPEAGEAAQDTPLGLDDPQRIRRSSGTTGGLKMMIGTRRVEEQRVERNLLFMGFTPHSRYFVTSFFTVGNIYALATACLRLGATCIFEARFPLAKSIERYRPSHIWMYQFQMKALDELPAGFAGTSGLTLMMGSAPVSGTLWRKILDRLTGRIIYAYSCNEVGNIATTDVDGVCTLRPGVRAEVVNEDGVPVTGGQVGQVRVRTTGMVDGYLDNPEATAQSFRDGWFYTGDAGVMLDSRKLRLSGRSDDLLNLGGLKVPPTEIETLAKRSVPLEDVAVTSVRNADGVEEVCIAVVLKKGADERECYARVAKSLPRTFGKVRFKSIDGIPRTAETGKVQRNRLKEFFTSK